MEEGLVSPFLEIEPENLYTALRGSVTGHREGARSLARLGTQRVKHPVKRRLGIRRMK
jgi:hypothetical protein